MKGNKGQVGTLMFALGLRWRRKDKGICSQTDVIAAKNNQSLWMNEGEERLKTRANCSVSAFLNRWAVEACVERSHK